MTEKILACPYCGGDDLKVAKYTEYGQHIYVTCNDCGSRGPESASQSSDDAILRWNAAANALAAKDAEIDKLRADLAESQEQLRMAMVRYNANHANLMHMIDKLRKESDAVREAQEDAHTYGVYRELVTNYRAEIEQLSDNLSALDMIANAMQQQRDEARRVARFLYYKDEP